MKEGERKEDASFLSMESLPARLSQWEYLVFLILRPVLAISFVVLFISLGWFLAWKLVLVHVPLVQEIFGMRKKPAKPKPITGRFSRYYNSINARNSTSASGANISSSVGDETS